MIIPCSTKRKLKTRSSLREKQDHYVNSSRVSSRICHINITPSNKKYKLLYIRCNWKLYYTLVESAIYLITISSHKISFRKLSAIRGRWLEEFPSWRSKFGLRSLQGLLVGYFCFQTPFKSLELSVSELTRPASQQGRRHEISQHSWPCFSILVQRQCSTHGSTIYMLSGLSLPSLIRMVTYIRL